MKQNETPQFEWLPVDALTVDEEFNLRESAEVTANAKEIAKSFHASGAIDPTAHHVTYEQVGDQKIVRDGHSLFRACEKEEFGPIPCLRKEFATEGERTAFQFRANSSRPLTRSAQGKGYCRLRDGVGCVFVETQNGDDSKGERGNPAKPFKTAKAAELAAFRGDTITEDLTATPWQEKPMSIKEIETLTGKSGEHIRQCIIGYEQPEDVAKMLDDGKVNFNAIVEASRKSESDTKKLALLKAAYQLAKGEGKETATEKHVKAVKAAQNAPKLKPQVEATTTNKKTAPNENEQKGAEALGDNAETDNQGSGEPSGSVDSGDGEVAESQPESDQLTDTPREKSHTPQSLLDLGATSDTPKKQSKSESRKQRATLLTIIQSWSDETAVGATGDQIDKLIDALLEGSALPF